MLHPRLRALAVALTALLGLSLLTAMPAEAGQKITPRFFGLHVGDPVGNDAQTTYGAINYTINGVYWPSIETSPGVFDFTRLDALVAAAKARNAKPTIVLGFTPEFHSTRPGSKDDAGTPNYHTTVPEMTAWKRYVRTVVGRYTTDADYQVWPEPNIVQNYTGTPRQLANLTRAASGVVNSVAPRAVLSSPALVLRLKGQQKWFDQFFSQRFNGKGMGAFVDVVSLDPYPVMKGTPEDSITHIRWARKTLKKYGISKPIWNAEINYGIVGAHDPSPQLPEGLQAAYVARTYVLNAAENVKRVYWLLWGSVAELGISTLNADGTLTKAGKAYGVVRSWLVNTRTMGCQVTKGVYTCTVKSSTGERRIYWRVTGSSKVTVPSTATFKESMTGARTSIKGGTRLTVTKFPVMVGSND